MTRDQEQLSFSIIDTQMTVKSMRDSGYKSTTHALAELIDNSIESGATVIEIFGVARRDSRTSRYTLQELAVLDNGVGMNPLDLRGSLRYGHGTRRERRGIGRFGLGLPNSSMSQARRVDVWSWQSGATNSLHTWLAIDDVEHGITEIPEPELDGIPKRYITASLGGFGDSGTLVVWSELDRVEWKQASTTFRHIERFLGRVYRRYLAKVGERLHVNDSRRDQIGPQRTIRCIPVRDSGWSVEVSKEEIVEVCPNDPLYLMTDTSCPEDFGQGPMFKELEGSPFSVPVKYNGTSHNVKVRASYAKPHVRDSSHSDAQWPERYLGRDSGNTPWGQHASSNRGVSMMRAHREVQLDESWINRSDSRERWWTIEIDFPTALDELFGVTNNKQGTVNFQRLSGFENWERYALPGENSMGEVRRRLEEDGDPLVHLFDLNEQVRRAIGLMRPRVKEARKQRGTRHADDKDRKADQKATAVIKRRIGEGHRGESDLSGEVGTREEQADKQVNSLVNRHHFDRQDALERILETSKTGNRVRWIRSALNSPAFFEVEPLPNVIQVALNENHPVHDHLYEMIHAEFDDLDEDGLRDQLGRGAAAFRILIYSWARYEEEQTARHRRAVRDARLEWGKYAEEFFDEDDGSSETGG